MKKPTFIPIEEITRPALTTKEASFYLNRKEQTLREWVCLGRGPIKPINVGGRLMWPKKQIQDLIAGKASNESELLFVLCELLGCIEVYAPDYMHGLPKREYVKKALDAIAKATGKQP